MGLKKHFRDVRYLEDFEDLILSLKIGEYELIRLTCPGNKYQRLYTQIKKARVFGYEINAKQVGEDVYYFEVTKEGDRDKYRIRGKHRSLSERDELE